MSGALHRVGFLVAGVTLPFAASAAAQDETKRPNVVLVMTDDQGYGDLACHGNREIRTPALDALHAESVRLTNYHVDPTCSPTRAALMTGRYSSRTGVWHTIMGRSILRGDEVTLADLLSRAGYATGIFGKWHLGDNYPSRPQDCGFQEGLIHGGGGVGQTPDYWGNDYFGDTYFHNGRPKKFDGYCTDVWFDGALRFIEENRDRPFFAYIATNAPHAPFNVDERYSRPYRDAGIPSPRAEFYGMITNIDENLARLRHRLDELDLAENTIVIFTTDNGTAAGAQRGGFNAGMRGQKGAEYEGGHRVPCFIRWPSGGIGGGRNVAELTAHIDMLPTLVELCRVELPAELKLDGRSLAPLLRGSRETVRSDCEGRTLLVHSQRIEHPEKWRKCAAMQGAWRLINGEELYDVESDPGQKENVAAEHPQVVAELRQAYESWWSDLSQRFDDYSRIVLGAPQENPSHLTCHDWHTEDVPWNQTQVAKNPEANGPWAVEIAREGRYEFTLRLRPKPFAHSLPRGTARVRIGDREATGAIVPEADAATVVLDLPAGPAMLQTWLDGDDGTSRGAYFVEVRRLR